MFFRIFSDPFPIRASAIFAVFQGLRTGDFFHGFAIFFMGIIYVKSPNARRQPRQAAKTIHRPALVNFRRYTLILPDDRHARDMGGKNRNLNAAKRARQDEFYARLADIERERERERE